MNIRTQSASQRKPKIPGAKEIRSIVAPLVGDNSPPPTDLKTIAERLNTSIIYERISGSGELRRVPGGWEIVCNSTLPSSRSRFTIAHELGHVLLAQERWEGTQQGKAAERFCDAVAIELLMPTDAFREDLQTELSIPRLLQLSERYGTSLQATVYRCVEVGDLTVVEAHSGRVLRVHGPLRGFAGLDDEAFRDLIKRACTGTAGSARLYLRHNDTVRLWNVIYHPMSRRAHALLLIDSVKE